MLPINCPECGSRHVRTSLTQGFFEKLGKAIGIFPLRCKDCDCRFSRQIWDIANSIYARCPVCYNLELSLWQPSFYRPPRSWKVLLAFGAKPRRCEACRKNFVSFRPCKIRFRRRKAQGKLLTSAPIPH